MFQLKTYHYFEILAFFCSIIFFKNIRVSHLKWLAPFLGIMVSTELTARYIRVVLGNNNTFIYNFSIPFEYIFYALLFAKVVLNDTCKVMCWIIAVCLICFCLINLLFIQNNITLLATNNLKFGNITMIILACIVLYDVFATDIEISILKKPLFWLGFAVLFFNLGEYMYFSVINLLLKRDLDSTMKLFKHINNSLIIFLYSFIIIAILCTKNIQKRISLT